MASSSSNRLERGWRVLEWETFPFSLQPFEKKKKKCVNKLYNETKFSLRLNIFGLENLLESFLA